MSTHKYVFEGNKKNISTFQLKKSTLSGAMGLIKTKIRYTKVINLTLEGLITTAANDILIFCCFHLFFRFT